MDSLGTLVVFVLSVFAGRTLVYFQFWCVTNVIIHVSVIP
jgi:hypothetical protein